jgi:hypothetical protein
VKNIIPLERIERSIVVGRNCKVLLDSDLAELYGVAAKNLIKATKRNLERFAPDFMFQLSRDEVSDSRFQAGTSRSP